MRSVLSISLPEKIAQELNEFAREMGRNKSEIVKESISLYLWEQRFRESRKRLSVRAKKTGMVTEDDVFKAVS
jgi:metal-responsive CopG/Arc/MetJ family transcriptional regulator